MANWISPRQKEILSLLNPELQKDFMESFLGEETFQDRSNGPKVAERMMELVKNHPFWGQKTPEGKYKFISNPKMCKVKQFWKKKKLAIECGGYFFGTAFFTIVCETGEIHSLTNSYQVFEQREKNFMMRLDKFQEKYEMSYGEKTEQFHAGLLGSAEQSEPWKFFAESELME